MMSYIDLINNFWLLDISQCFTPTETKYYFYFLHLGETFNWNCKITRTNVALVSEICCSMNKFLKARERFSKLGLITYSKQKGVKGYIYRINNNYDVHEKLDEI